MYILPGFNSWIRLQQFLYFVLKGVDFATYRTIDLLQVLQIGYIVVYIEQSHELVVLRAELVELTLYFLYIALHLNINDSSHYSHTLTLYIKREWAVNEEIWAASVLSASTAKSHSKTKSFYITTKRPNISAAPNVPRNSPALTPCCNTHAVNTTNRYREYPQLFTVEIAWLWRFLVCRACQELKSRVGFRVA